VPLTPVGNEDAHAHGNEDEDEDVHEREQYALLQQAADN